MLFVAEFRRNSELFCMNIEATKVAKITGVSRQSVNKLFPKIRERIAEDRERSSPLVQGTLGLGESCFGAGRVRGSRGKGAAEKIPVLGILKKVAKSILRLCKVRLLRFRGTHKHRFYFQLKECELRFNMRSNHIYQYLVKMFRNNPLKLS